MGSFRMERLWTNRGSDFCTSVNTSLLGMTIDRCIVHQGVCDIYAWRGIDSNTISSAISILDMYFLLRCRVGEMYWRQSVLFPGCCPRDSNPAGVDTTPLKRQSVLFRAKPEHNDDHLPGHGAVRLIGAICNLWVKANQTHTLLDCADESSFSDSPCIRCRWTS